MTQVEDRLEFFRNLKREKGKIPWAERSKLIKNHFPSTARLDWFEVFRQDPAIAGKIISDIIKTDQERDGRPGKRPSLGEELTAEKLRQLQGEDYSDLEFPKAFKVLCGNRSVRNVAHKTGLAPTRVHQLFKGEIVPTVETMEKIARAFKKKPAYFVEYRIGYIIGVIAHKLEQIPETSTVLYKKIAGRNERNH